jgi:hypothetical protein
VITDAARRMSDIINLTITFNGVWEIKDKWMAFRLSDGSTDGALYDTRQDAINHQSNPQWCAYQSFRNLLSGAKPLDCQIFLDVNRQAAEMNLHEDHAPQLILPTAYYDFLNDRKRPGG